MFGKAPCRWPKKKRVIRLIIYRRIINCSFSAQGIRRQLTCETPCLKVSYGALIQCLESAFFQLLWKFF